MKNPVIYAIIVTYNGLRWVDRCFSSLRRSSVPLVPVVVDNGSADGTVACIRCNYPEAMIIRNACNRGFGQANNAGIRYALEHGADYVFLLNQDTWIFENTVEALLAAATPEYGIVSPVHLNGGGRALDGNFRIFLSANPVPMLEDCLTGRSGGIYPLPFVNAAAWLLPRDTIVRVGGFDPLFFHYGEDDNYCQRVLYHGLKIGVVPASLICHDSNEKGYLEYPGLRERIFTVFCADINLTDEQVAKYRQQIRRRFYGPLSPKLENTDELREAYSALADKWKRIRASRETNRAGGPNWL